MQPEHWVRTVRLVPLLQAVRKERRARVAQRVRRERVQPSVLWALPVQMVPQGLLEQTVPREHWVPWAR